MQWAYHELLAAPMSLVQAIIDDLELANLEARADEAAGQSVQRWE